MRRLYEDEALLLRRNSLSFLLPALFISASAMCCRMVREAFSRNLRLVGLHIKDLDKLNVPCAGDVMMYKLVDVLKKVVNLDYASILRLFVQFGPRHFEYEACLIPSSMKPLRQQERRVISCM